MEELKLLLKNMANLVKVKSIMSLAMIFALIYGFVSGMISGEVFAGFVGAIITYFFTRKDAE
jgi:hypothetical protein